jgi:hypothetical protein
MCRASHSGSTSGDVVVFATDEEASAAGLEKDILVEAGFNGASE